MLIASIIFFIAAGYSLHLMCMLRRLHKDPRPASFSVFVLAAWGILNLTAATSQPTIDLSLGWFAVNVATAVLICWLVVLSMRGKRNVKS